MSHYEPKISEKLRIKDPNSTDIINLMKKDNINIDETYVHHKKLLPENMQNLNNLNFEFSLKNKNSYDTKKKFILLINENEKMNRNVMLKFKKISKKNPDVDFYYMFSTPENEVFLKEKFNLEFKKYPQMIIYNNNIDNNNDNNEKLNNKNININLFSEEALLSYNTKIEELNELINRLI